MQLNRISGRIRDDGLLGKRGGERVADLEPLAAQLVDHRIEIFEQQREMLPLLGGNGALQEVQLLMAGVEPSTANAEIGSIVPDGQAKRFGVKADGRIDVVNDQSDVVNSEWLHNASLLRRDGVA